MLNVLARNWWVVLLRGIAAVLFGIIAFLWPGLTGFALVLFFGVYALVDGIFALVSAIRAAEARHRWWPFVVEGIIGIAIAAVVYFDWRVAALALYYTIAVWALLTGIFEIVAAIELRKMISGEWLLILAGVLSIVFAALLVAYPSAGILTVIWLIAFYAVIFGVTLIALSFRLRSHVVD
jgi:uncharacterized membrane protein HdeD (DUF308 family)